MEPYAPVPMYIILAIGATLFSILTTKYSSEGKDVPTVATVLLCFAWVPLCTYYIVFLSTRDTDLLLHELRQLGLMGEPADEPPPLDTPELHFLHALTVFAFFLWLEIFLYRTSQPANGEAKNGQEENDE